MYSRKAHAFFNTYFFQTIRCVNTIYDLKYNKQDYKIQKIQF